MTRNGAAAAALACAALCGCGRAAGECDAFDAWVKASEARATSAVPAHDGGARRSAAEVAADVRKVASAFDAEASAPARFSTAKVRDYEAHVKRTYLLRAAALRETAASIERGDAALRSKGHDEEVAAVRERLRVVQDAERHCRD
ncbi:MAG TPA: hypothetical protein VHB21_12005 [Minicystis sp.]|nr:hypothetical protein [Minicystis sp.]